jgi:NADH dehydrogenase FAD-containing subunit
LDKKKSTVVIVGAGIAGLVSYHKLKAKFNTIVIDMKNWFEFAPSTISAIMNPTKFNRISFEYR